MELTFEKWEDGRWFVVLPDYDGDQEDLEMVDGADAFLDYLTEDGLYVTINVSLEDTEDDAIILKLAAHDSIGCSPNKKCTTLHSQTSYLNSGKFSTS